jgi:curli biogenesis system outer membrane secretion channel CsgG
MFVSLLLVGMLFQVPATSGQPAKSSVVGASAVPTPPQGKPVSKETEAVDPSELLKVKRVYVDSFGDDVISKEMQSLIVSSLVATKRFRVTENRERADAILKGVALEKSSQEVHAYGEGTAVGGASGSSSGSVNGSFINGTGSVHGSSSGGFAASQMATSDSSLNTETVNEARIAVRLVNPEGDVIWTSTQESKGAKYKGSSADVADKCVKQLLRDVERLESKGTGESTTSTSGRH